MSGNKPYDKKKCGAKTRSGSPCGRPAGWGTDHPGSGRCKLHGGCSTGPKTEAGKQKVRDNAIKHAGYVERLLNEDERILYSHLYDGTIEKHELDPADPVQMSMLQRACITWIKLLRLDEWELEEEIVAMNELTEKDPETGEEQLVGTNIYNEDGQIIGKQLVKVKRLQWAKTPNWETHFQKYMQLLGVDRQTKIRQQGANQMAQAVDQLSWLWGGKSVEDGA